MSDNENVTDLIVIPSYTYRINPNIKQNSIVQTLLSDTLWIVYQWIVVDGSSASYPLFLYRVTEDEPVYTPCAEAALKMDQATVCTLPIEYGNVYAGLILLEGASYNMPNLVFAFKETDAGKRYIQSVISKGDHFEISYTSHRNLAIRMNPNELALIPKECYTGTENS